MQNPEDMRSRKIGGVLLALAILSGIGLMIPLLTAGPITLDEHGSYWVIDSDLPSSSWERGLGYSAIPPLSGWLQEIFLAVLGKSEWAFRLPSAVCYLVAIGVTYRLTHRLSGAVAAGIAALVLAWHPDAMDEVRIARCYGLVLLLSAVLLSASQRWHERPCSLYRAIAWGVAAAALLWSHVIAAPLVALTWCSVVLPIPKIQPSERPSLLSVTLASTTLLLLASPLILFVERLLMWTPFLSATSSSIPVWQVLSPIWWLGIPLALGVAWVTPHRQELSPDFLTIGQSRRLLAFWTMIPLAAMALLSWGYRGTLANPRYLVPYAVGSACLFAHCLPARSRTWGTIVGTVVAISVTWAISGQVPWVPGRLNGHSDHDWYLMARLIQEEGQSGEPIFVQSGLAESSAVPQLTGDRLFLEYVACRISRFYVETPHPRYGLPFVFRWMEHSQVVNAFRSMAFESQSGSSADLWVASATDTDINRRSYESFCRILEADGFRRIKTWPFDSAVLLRYRRPTRKQ